LGGECCWLYEDKKGMKHGPHSISELISWHHHGYLEDSTVVRCNNLFNEIIYNLQIWCRKGNDELISFLKEVHDYYQFHVPKIYILYLKYFLQVH
jgi:hypothetical protein